MAKTLLTTAAAAAALLALSACDKKSHTIVADAPVDTQAAALAKAKPVELPPAIQASRTYRCADNSLIYVDFYTNNTAMVRTSKTGNATTLTAPAAGAAYTADGYAVGGNGASTSITVPGKSAQTCKA